MAAPGTRRDAAKAVKTADAVMASMRSAGEAATATTLAGITQMLKANTPLMYHIHALLQNQAWRAELEASANGPSDRKNDSGVLRPSHKQTLLQCRIKRFEHLRKTPHQISLLGQITETWAGREIDDVFVCRPTMKQTERPSLRYGPTEMFKVPQKWIF